MNRDELKLKIILDNDRHIRVTRGAKAVLDELMNGSGQFIEVKSKDGYRHYVNVNHIVEALEVYE